MAFLNYHPNRYHHWTRLVTSVANTFILSLSFLLMLLAFLLHSSLAAPSSSRAHHFVHTREAVDRASEAILIGQSSCRPNENLILIHSTAGRDMNYHFFRRRTAIRQTWAPEAAAHKHRVIFVMGVAHGNDTQSQRSLVTEADEYGDILQFDFLDNGLHETIKSLAELRWARAHCPDARYLLKLNDNVALNVNLLRQLTAGNYSKLPPGIIGSIVDVPGSSQSTYLPAGYRPAARYTYARSFAWLLTGDQLEPLMAAFDRYTDPIFERDNLFITGVLAQSAGIKRHNRTRLFHSHRFCANNHFCEIEKTLAFVTCRNSIRARLMYRRWMRTVAHSKLRCDSPVTGNFRSIWTAGTTTSASLTNQNLFSYGSIPGF